MRKLMLFANVSLDGFMAGPENDLGFMVDDEEMDRQMTAELMRTADTIVVGRTAYEDDSGRRRARSSP
jgi:dihydrofolate reductase